MVQQLYIYISFLFPYIKQLLHLQLLLFLSHLTLQPVVCFVEFYFIYLFSLLSCIEFSIRSFFCLILNSLQYINAHKKYFISLFTRLICFTSHLTHLRSFVLFCSTRTLHFVCCLVLINFRYFYALFYLYVVLFFVLSFLTISF